MAWWRAWARWRSAWCCSSGEGFPANGLSPLAAGRARCCGWAGRGACQPRDERSKSEARAARVSQAWLDSTRAAARTGSAFLLMFRGWRARSVEGRSGWVGGGVRGMDAAAKPPGMGSRRPPPTHPNRPKPGSRFGRQPRGGCARWPVSPAGATSACPAPRPAHRPAARSAHTGSCRRPARTPATRHAGTGASVRSAHEAAC